MNVLRSNADLEVFRCFGAADPVGNFATQGMYQANCYVGKWDCSNARGCKDLWRTGEDRMASSKNNRICVMVSISSARTLFKLNHAERLLTSKKGTGRSTIS